MTDETNTTTTAPAIAYRYVGNGDHLSGIPARDLTADDITGFDDETKETLTKSGVYEGASDEQ